MIFFCPERFYDFFPLDRLRNFFVLRDCMIFLFQEVFFMLFKNLDTVPYWLLFLFLASLYLVLLKYVAVTTSFGGEPYSR